MIINKEIMTGYIDDSGIPILQFSTLKEPIRCYHDELSYYQQHSEYCKDHAIYLVEISTYSPNLHKIIESFFNAIPLDIQNKIRNKEIIFGIYSPYEPMYGYKVIDSIYQDIVINYSIPESQILFVCGAYDYRDYALQMANMLNKELIKLEYFSHMQLYIRNNIKEYNVTSSLNKARTKRKFLFLNKFARPHRVGLACILNNKNLLEHSYTSLLDCTSINWEECVDQSKQLFNGIKDHFKSDTLKNRVPLQLDIDLTRISTYEQAEYNFSVFLLKYFYQTYFSVVTETLYNSNNPRYFTEKMFKPIAAKHPFILVSCPKSLESLRFLGFKTFFPLINEDYDLETDDSKRLLMIADEVERLCNLSEPELKLFKEQALEIVEYNYNHLMTTDNLVFKLL